MTAPVRIVHLYPEELGITGDRGNARALQTRLSRAGVEAEILRVGIGEKLPSDADVIVLGNGPLSAMRGVHDDLRARTGELEAFVAAEGALLAVGASAELLGAGIRMLDGSSLDGIGVFSFTVRRVRDRRVGYIVVDSPAGHLVGFEDHASEWTLSAEAEVFGSVAEGKGSFAVRDARGEIVRRGGAYATNLQGPVLPLNPALTDQVLRGAAARRGVEWPLGEGSDELDRYASAARATIERLIHNKSFSSMGV